MEVEGDVSRANLLKYGSPSALGVFYTDLFAPLVVNRARTKKEIAAVVWSFYNSYIQPISGTEVGQEATRGLYITSQNDKRETFDDIHVLVGIDTVENGGLRTFYNEREGTNVALYNFVFVFKRLYVLGPKGLDSLSEPRSGPKPHYYAESEMLFLTTKELLKDFFGMSKYHIVAHAKPPVPMEAHQPKYYTAELEKIQKLNLEWLNRNVSWEDFDAGGYIRINQGHTSKTRKDASDTTNQPFRAMFDRNILSQGLRPDGKGKITTRLLALMGMGTFSDVVPIVANEKTKDFGSFPTVKIDPILLRVTDIQDILVNNNSHTKTTLNKFGSDLEKYLEDGDEISVGPGGRKSDLPTFLYSSVTIEDPSTDARVHGKNSGLEALILETIQAVVASDVIPTFYSNREWVAFVTGLVDRSSGAALSLPIRTTQGTAIETFHVGEFFRKLGDLLEDSPRKESKKEEEEKRQREEEKRKAEERLQNAKERQRLEEKEAELERLRKEREVEERRTAELERLQKKREAEERRKEERKKKETEEQLRKEEASRARTKAAKIKEKERQNQRRRAKNLRKKEEKEAKEKEEKKLDKNISKKLSVDAQGDDVDEAKPVIFEASVFPTIASIKAVTQVVEISVQDKKTTERVTETTRPIRASQRMHVSSDFSRAPIARYGRKAVAETIAVIIQDARGQSNGVLVANNVHARTIISDTKDRGFSVVFPIWIKDGSLLGGSGPWQIVGKVRNEVYVHHRSIFNVSFSVAGEVRTVHLDVDIPTEIDPSQMSQLLYKATSKKNVEFTIGIGFDSSSSKGLSLLRYLFISNG